jgi:1-phosphatidylinositol-4-phosphate 5-kinase
MKSLNIYKKLHKITKTKRSKRHFSKNFKGKVIDGVHELYTLTAGMMLGIRFSLSRGYENEAYADNTTTHQDFDEVENVFFPPKGSNTPPFITPPHSLAHTFKFKSYAPKIFKQLREFFDIDPIDYSQSVCGDYNYLEFISNSKSGQFFFYSHDGKYMLKTQTKEENKFLKRILPKYFKYLKENPHSLLVRILGEWDFFSLVFECV